MMMRVAVVIVLALAGCNLVHVAQPDDLGEGEGEGDDSDSDGSFELDGTGPDLLRCACSDGAVVDGCADTSACTALDHCDDRCAAHHGARDSGCVAHEVRCEARAHSLSPGNSGVICLCDTGLDFGLCLTVDCNNTAAVIDFCADACGDEQVGSECTSVDDSCASDARPSGNDSLKCLCDDGQEFAVCTEGRCDDGSLHEQDCRALCGGAVSAIGCIKDDVAICP
jgi:hypothetical protein